jgi:hypothetical protein
MYELPFSTEAVEFPAELPVTPPAGVLIVIVIDWATESVPSVHFSVTAPKVLDVVAGVVTFK